MNKYFTFLAFALMATFGLAFVSCSDDSKDDGGGGDDYSVKMPSGTTDVIIEPVTDEELSVLKSQGHKFIARPVNVTRSGEKHVVLDNDATVSFKIPENYPKEKYNELVGVLIGEDGPEYIIPELDGLREGVVRFKTYHFSTAGAVQNQEELEKKFVDHVAVNDWTAGLREADFNKLEDRLKTIAEESGFGENDLMGFAFREVMKDNDFAKKTVEYINAYDNDKLIDNAALDLAKTVDKEIKAKVLSVLFGKLQTDPDNVKVKDFLQEHLNQENMEDVGKRLGEGQSPATIAWEYASGFAKERLKEFSVKLSNGYIKYVQAEAKTIDILTKFYNQQRARDMYEEFEKEYAHIGQTNEWNDVWNALVQKYRISTPEFSYGMSVDEIRKMFEKRYEDQKKVNAKKTEVQKLLELWRKQGFLGIGDDASLDIKNYFGENDDYILRMTRIHGLMERFRKELVVDGYLNGKSNINTINEYLCDIVDHWISMSISTKPKYNMPEDFYKWLAKEGYIDKKLKKQVDDLDEFRSWRLVKTEAIAHENTTGDRGQYMNYSASATELSKEGKVIGRVGPYKDVDKLFDLCFVVTIQEPPTTLNAGDTLRMHITAKRTTDAALDEYNKPAYYDYTAVEMWWNIYNSSGYFSVEKLDGPKGGPSSYSTVNTSTWDYVYRVPSGSKDKEESVYLTSCGGKVIWTYRWCGPFD